MWLGLAAVGCAGLAFYGVYMQQGARDSHAALGSLEQVPALAAPSEPVSPAAPSAIPSAVPRTPEASANAASTSTQSITAGTPRPVGKERNPDPGSELGRAQALVAEGTTLQSQGRLGLAESAYQKALSLVPEYPSAMAALVRVHLARRDGAEALRWATRLVAKQPKDASFQLLLGDALALRGDLQGARDAWTDAAEHGNAMARQRLQ
jgi:tetratricopeptide (TPR) repeat protein